MNRRDLLSYLGCSAITLMGKDARPCPTCGSLHTRHRHGQKCNQYQSIPSAKLRLST